MTSPTQLKDMDLLRQTKRLVLQERHLLGKILNHLEEIERRKLFADLGYQSLFDYMVKYLRYSEGQAGRRIQAMKLCRELPELGDKIQSGSLSLSNISQAQSFFREQEKLLGQKSPDKSSKLEVLEKLEHLSAREGQKLLLGLQETPSLPKEQERWISSNHLEIRFVMDTQLKAKLTELRAHLGSKGHNMTFSELLCYMAETSVEHLLQKRFGKKRIQMEASSSVQPDLKAYSNPQGSSKEQSRSVNLKPITPTSERQRSKNLRYISRSTKFKVWQRDAGQCQKCGSRAHLNFDHIKPVALGGGAEESNLRLLCFNCNQRQAIKSFGVVFRDEFSKTIKCLKYNS